MNGITVKSMLIDIHLKKKKKKKKNFLLINMLFGQPFPYRTEYLSVPLKQLLL